MFVNNLQSDIFMKNLLELKSWNAIGQLWSTGSLSIYFHKTGKNYLIESEELDLGCLYHFFAN